MSNSASPLANRIMRNEELRHGKKSLNIYLAASWSRRREIQLIAVKLTRREFKVTSGWLYQEATPENAALMDVADVARADTIIRFSDREVVEKADTVYSHLATGARHFEFGYAYAQGKRMIVVGGYQNVFDSLPHVEHVKDEEELWTILIKGK